MSKNVVAKTFTPIYDETEDRIRLSVNYQDANDRIDFMITRNFILQLMPTVEEYLYKYYPNAQEILIPKANYAESAKEGLKENQSLSLTDGNNFNLYKSDEDLLVKIDFSFDEKTKQTKILFTSKNKLTAVSLLNAELLQQIMNMIRLKIPSFKWGISNSF